MLNESNYHSQEMNAQFMSASSFKDFLSCESMALAKLKGEYEEEKSTALLVGSMVDAHFSKCLPLFKAQNPEIFTQKGDLKSEYRHAEYIIARIERDPMFMRYISGEAQVIKTGEIEGVPCKIKIDSYHPEKAIVDLKIMRSMEPAWKNGLKLSFVEVWQYDVSMSFYQSIEGNGLPVFLAVATKEKPEPDIAIVSINQERLDYCLNEIIKPNIKRFDDIKKGLIEPIKCGQCDWCRQNKVITEIIDYTQLSA